MRIIANSLPKSGTHILVRLFELAGLAEDKHALTGALIRPTSRSPFRKYLIGQRRALASQRGLQIDLDDLSCSVKTSWLKRYIEKIPDNSFVAAHLPYSHELSNFLKIHGFKIIYIYRDPRDVLVSYVNHQKRDAAYPFHDFYQKCNETEQLLSVFVPMISGAGQKRAGLKERVLNSIGWIDDAGVCSVKFEEIIGVFGGGDAPSQKKAVRRIFDHLGVDWDGPKIDEMVGKIFYAKSETFHKGRIGQWKEVCPDEIREVLKLFCGDVITRLGYEKDLNW